jgi:hypothetical protein
MSRPVRTALLLLGCATLLLAPAAAAAQACGIVPGVSAGGGYARYRVAGGTAGVAVGGDVALDISSVAAQVGYRRILLDGDAVDPDVIRAVVALPAARLEGVAVCGVVHGGLTRFTYESDSGAVLAAGLGVVVSPASASALRPYLSVRGLGARATGTALDLDVDASGLSVGVEAGVTALLGPAAVRFTGTVDGFDDGLGVTPYPNTSAELAVQLRF